MASLSFLHMMLLSPTLLFLSDFHIVPPLCLVKSISHSYPFASYVAAETKPMGRVAAPHPHPCCSLGLGSLVWIARAGAGNAQRTLMLLLHGVASWRDTECAEMKAGTTLRSGMETLRG